MSYDRRNRGGEGPSRDSPASPQRGHASGKVTRVQLRQQQIDRDRRYRQGPNPPDDVHGIAARGVADKGTPLPHCEAIQESFGPGHDVSGIEAHVGGVAAEASEAIGAEAYATGNDVAFRDQPDLHTAAHEAAHVVQQRGGVQLLGGVGEAGDVYERQADAVADAVVTGQPAGHLLHPSPSASGGVAVQRKIMDGGGSPAHCAPTAAAKRLGVEGLDNMMARVVDEIEGIMDQRRAGLTQVAEQIDEDDPLVTPEKLPLLIRLVKMALLYEPLIGHLAGMAFDAVYPDPAGTTAGAKEGGGGLKGVAHHVGKSVIDDLVSEGITAVKGKIDEMAAEKVANYRSPSARVRFFGAQADILDSVRSGLLGSIRDKYDTLEEAARSDPSTAETALDALGMLQCSLADKHKTSRQDQFRESLQLWGAYLLQEKVGNTEKGPKDGRAMRHNENGEPPMGTDLSQVGGYDTKLPKGLLEIKVSFENPTEDQAAVLEEIPYNPDYEVGYFLNSRPAIESARIKGMHHGFYDELKAIPVGEMRIPLVITGQIYGTFPHGSAMETVDFGRDENGTFWIGALPQAPITIEELAAMKDPNRKDEKGHDPLHPFYTTPKPKDFFSELARQAGRPAEPFEGVKLIFEHLGKETLASYLKD